MASYQGGVWVYFVTIFVFMFLSTDPNYSVNKEFELVGTHIPSYHIFSLYKDPSPIVWGQLLKITYVINLRFVSNRSKADNTRKFFSDGTLFALDETPDDKVEIENGSTKPRSTEECGSCCS